MSAWVSTDPVCANGSVMGYLCFPADDGHAHEEEIALRYFGALNEDDVAAWVEMDEAAAVQESGHFFFGFLIDGEVDQERVERDGVGAGVYLLAEVRQCRDCRRDVVGCRGRGAAKEYSCHWVACALVSMATDIPMNPQVSAGITFVGAAGAGAAAIWNAENWNALRWNAVWTDAVDTIQPSRGPVAAARWRPAWP